MAAEDELYAKRLGFWLRAARERSGKSQAGAAELLGFSPKSKSTISDYENGVITRAELGASWPFAVDDGELRCNELDGRPLVTFAVDGIEYALNGAARDVGFPELDTTVLPSWPDVSGLGPLIERALELC